MSSASGRVAPRTPNKGFAPELHWKHGPPTPTLDLPLYNDRPPSDWRVDATVENRYFLRHIFCQNAHVSSSVLVAIHFTCYSPFRFAFTKMLLILAQGFVADNR